ncbi:hypothetical protein ACVWZX_000523 [Deinococcus sp. UYEF24]
MAEHLGQQVNGRGDLVMPSDEGLLTDADRARTRAEEVERLRVRTELEAERRKVQFRSENRGCLGTVNFFLKVTGW